jgi:hypothetical protein
MQPPNNATMLSIIKKEVNPAITFTAKQIGVTIPQSVL